MKFLNKIWRWVRWPLLVVSLGYIAFIAYYIPIGRDQYLSDQTVARIYAQKITMADVMGTVPPHQPYAPENDATVAGIDKNGNGIRDDVELAIFAKYPHSAKIRAAELQYALDQQELLTEVTNTATWVAQAQEYGRGYGCISDTVPRNGNLSDEVKLMEARAKEVDDLVFNTQARKDVEKKTDAYTTSFGDMMGTQNCDIDLNTLPN